MLRNLLAVFIALWATLIAIGIGFSFLSAHLPLADSISHFRLHLTATLFVATALLAVLSSWRSAFIVLVVAIVGVAGLGPAIPFWQSVDAALEGRSLRVLQINLLFGNGTSRPIIDLIRREKPDIVTMQELGRNARPVIARLAQDYPYRIVCKARRFANVAILSRWPAALAQRGGCARGLAFAWLRIVVNGQPFSVATVHLNWPYPFDQWQHIDALENKLASLPRPVLFGGDFNAAPWSAAVGRLAELTDTQVVRGLRLSLVKSLSLWLPSFRLPIDHVLKPDILHTASARLGPSVGSDHLPIIVTFTMK